MKLSSVLAKAKKFVTPSKDEEKKISSITKSVIKKVDAQIKKKRIHAKLIVGGSVAKGTWLPGISDIDFFLQFNYKDYETKSALLSDISEKILRSAFKKIERVHGSRDYFTLQNNGFNIEIVPVLKISSPEKAKNITDVSPLHINWVRKKVRKSKKLVTEIRLAKQFFKANRLYGAESYIKGFSGHVIEVLTIYYGSFAKLVGAIAKWKQNEIIDIEKRYKNKKEVFKAINPSKRQGPLIIVDPIEPGRNAAAALSKEKYELAKKICQKFIRSPSFDFFEIKKINIEELIAKKGKRKLIIIKALPEKNKTDIAGAKLLKKFEWIKKELLNEGFKIIVADWWWDEKSLALFWFYFDPKPLPKIKKHWGPPLSAKKENIDSFRKKWKKYKIKKSKGRLYVEVKRLATTPEQFLKNLLRKERGVRCLLKLEKLNPFKRH